MVLEIGIMLWHFSWVYRNRRTLKDAKLAGMTYDQYICDDAKPPKTANSYNTDASRNDSLTPQTTLDKAPNTQSEKVEEHTCQQVDTERDLERSA